MKTRTLIAILALLAAPAFGEEDVRSKVAEADEQSGATALIDPDKSIFGIPLGTTEDEFIAKYGKPMGYLRLDSDETAMLYGKSHAFIFKDGQLGGVLLTYNTLDWDLSKGLRETQLFPSYNGWELSNGLKPEMTLADARKILGDKLTAEDSHGRYHQQYLTDKSRVKLSFSFRSGKAEDDENSYSLHSIFIRPKENTGQ